MKRTWQHESQHRLEPEVVKQSIADCAKKELIHFCMTSSQEIRTSLSNQGLEEKKKSNMETGLEKDYSSTVPKKRKEE